MSAEKHEFQAEVQKLLDLMIHSLYSNKDVCDERRVEHPILSYNFV